MHSTKSEDHAKTNGEDGPSQANGKPSSSKSPSGITSRALLQILKRQDRRCALTGRELTPETARIDHVQPLKHKGPHHIDNIQLLNNQVNDAKHTLTQAEFIQICREVVAWIDRPPS